MNLPQPSVEFLKQVKHTKEDRDIQLDNMFKFVTTQSEIPYIVLDKTFDSAKAYEEIKAVDAAGLFVRYHSKFVDSKTQGWYATALYGQSATNPWNAQTSLEYSHLPHQDNVWTESADMMPYMKSVLGEFLGIENVNRCVCFKLAPGGFVELHTDEPKHFGYIMKQINFHIYWPTGCTWYLEGADNGIHPTKNGTVTMHNSVANHVITNNSNEDRYFVWAFAELDKNYKKLVVDSYINKYHA